MSFGKYDKKRKAYYIVFPQDGMDPRATTLLVAKLNSTLLQNGQITNHDAVDTRVGHDQWCLVEATSEYDAFKLAENAGLGQGLYMPQYCNSPVLHRERMKTRKVAYDLSRLGPSS